MICMLKMFAVMHLHCLLVFARHISTVWGFTIDSRQNPLWRQQTRRGLPQRFPVCVTWFFCGWLLSDACPVGSDLRTRRVPHRKTTMLTNGRKILDQRHSVTSYHVIDPLSLAQRIRLCVAVALDSRQNPEMVACTVPHVSNLLFGCIPTVWDWPSRLSSVCKIAAANQK